MILRPVHVDNPHQHHSLVHLRLDPHSSNASFLEPFVSYKTSYREFCNSARQRTQAQSNEEVLLFQTKNLSPIGGAERTVKRVEEDASQLSRPFSFGKNDGLLTEGLYTNVAVYNSTKNRWVTPFSGCLRGIECQSLVDRDELIFGEIQRAELKVRIKVLLMNSVRGCFWPNHLT